MLLNKNIKQKVVAITNDLEKLIPIGTLNFFNLRYISPIYKESSPVISPQNLTMTYNNGAG